jgi:hypothetical protein
VETTSPERPNEDRNEGRNNRRPEVRSSAGTAVGGATAGGGKGSVSALGSVGMGGSDTATIHRTREA